MPLAIEHASNEPDNTQKFTEEPIETDESKICHWILVATCVHLYISNIQSLPATMNSQKTLLEQMKVNCAWDISGYVCVYILFQHTVCTSDNEFTENPIKVLDMSSNICTYINFQHTVCTSNNALTENPIGTDESKLCIGHE